MASNSILILVNKPHKPQMEVLKSWLESHLAKYNYLMVTQGNIVSKIRKLQPHAIITYNKNLYKTKVVRSLKEYCFNGGKLLTLHHNVSSMMLRQPDWLDFINVSITKGEVPHPWGTIEGGDNYLYNLAPGHPITSRGLSYNNPAPSLASFIKEMGLIGFHTDPTREIVTFELAGENKGNIVGVEMESTIKIPRSEYFINLVLNPEPSRKLLFAIHYRDEKKGKQYISANGGWVAPRGQGNLYYLMPGHGKVEYTNQFCTIIANCLEFEE